MTIQTQCWPVSTRKRKQVDYSYGGFAQKAEDDDWERKPSTKTNKAPKSASTNTKRKPKRVVGGSF